jgi:hypothetical protein
MTKDDLMEHWDAIVTDGRSTLAAAERHLADLSTDASRARTWTAARSGRPSNDGWRAWDSVRVGSSYVAWTRSTGRRRGS